MGGYSCGRSFSWIRYFEYPSIFSSLSSIHGVSTSDRSIDATTTNNVNWLWNSLTNTFSSFTQWFSSHGREERPEGDDMERASIIEGECKVSYFPITYTTTQPPPAYGLPETICEVGLQKEKWSKKYQHNEVKGFLLEILPLRRYECNFSTNLFNNLYT